ncbi:hypothetical protein PM082_013715 [Marasmius tenuissimus]|nr:hypothetical protein PM082_013715 [Marasmius tenuissimus]
MVTGAANPHEYLPLLEADQVIVYPQVTLLIVYFVYGTYALLFGLCIYILRRGPAFHHQKLYVIWTILMFSTASSEMVIETIRVFHSSMAYFAAVKAQDYLGLDQHPFYDTLQLTAFTLSALIFFASNVLADCVLIHRCHLIWNHRRISALLMATCFLANMTLLTGATMMALGYFIAKSTQSHLASEGNTITAGAMVASAVLNVILTCLTGR